jgi:FdrA protein
MFLEGMRALREDPATRVLVLVSKPPHESVLRRIAQAAEGIGKPVIAAFLGADPNVVRGLGMTPATTLEDAALMAVAASKGTRFQAAPDAPAEIAARPGQKYIRGLFSGGALCAEAQSILRDAGVGCLHSNVPLASVCRLEEPSKSRGHALVDLGDDAFTVGRPHPMIDYALRNRRILEESKDPGTALILLDVVLGYGANPDPVKELAPAIREAVRCVAVACSVTGTPRDPQDQSKVAAGLRAAGARVFASNAAASRFAAAVALAIGE